MLKIDSIDFGTHESLTGFRREAASLIRLNPPKEADSDAFEALARGGGKDVGHYQSQERVECSVEAWEGSGAE